MTKTERVLCALKCGTPDCVPYMYNTVMNDIQEKLLGRDLSDEPLINNFNVTGWLGGIDEIPEVIPSLTILPEAARLLNLDAIGIQVLPPLFVDAVDTPIGRFQKGGLISDCDRLKKIKMPDPDDADLFRKIEKMIEKYKQEFALYARIRLGAAPTLLSMGIDNFAYSLANEDELVPNTISMYTNWIQRFSKNLCEFDFDFFWCFDDIAFNTGMLISPDSFRTYFKNPMKNAASGIDRPFIFHSDGKIESVIDDIIEIGAVGLHPIEPGSMDSDWLKKTYGDKLCLIGNIDLDKFLTHGTNDSIDAEVKYRINQFGPGGGYIISDSNSIPSHCNPENILAMSRSVERHRYIYF